MKNKEIKKAIFSIISISLFLIITTTYIYIPEKENLLSSLLFLQNEKRFYMEDLSTGILLKEAVPVSDSVGLSNDSYRFKVVNNSNSTIKYQIIFQKQENKIISSGKEILENKYLRYTIKSEDTIFIEPTNLNDSGIIYETSISANSSTNFEFKMWLDYNSDNGAMNKVFVGKIEIEEIK